MVEGLRLKDKRHELDFYIVTPIYKVMMKGLAEIFKTRGLGKESIISENLKKHHKKMVLK